MPESLAHARDLYARGRFADARLDILKILRAEPENPSAHVLLGAIAIQAAQAREAEDHLLTAIRLDPEQFDALIFLANLRRSEKRIEEAIEFCLRAIGVSPESPVGYNTLGLYLVEANRPAEAVDALAKAVARDPRSAPAHHNLAVALAADNRPAEAVEGFMAAIRLAPGRVNGYLELARQLDWLSRWPEAIRYLTQGLKQQPDSVPLIVALARAHAKLNQATEAERRFKQALKIDPAAAQSYGLWLQEVGRFEESVAHLLDSVRREPNQGIAYFYLAEAKAFDLPDGSLEARIQAVDQRKLDPQNRMFLAYALGRCYDRLGRYEEAMGQFDTANELAYAQFNAGRPFDAEAARALVDRTKKISTAETLGRRAVHGSDSDEPIFIAGMIRSGTTLVDQIISSHPSVASAGELSFWRLHAQAPLETGSDFTKIVSEYLAELRKDAGNATRITDKMPTNYEHLGRIHAAFPRAKIVHVRRSPVDTCLSIYMTHFGRGPEFAYRRESIVENYRNYVALMDHWRMVLPADRFHEVDYESLVEDREAVTRNLIAFLDLPWDDACLRHEDNASAVMTPSRWQVRQPIYATSVARWRRYEPWLGVFRELLA